MLSVSEVPPLAKGIHCIRRQIGCKWMGFLYCLVGSKGSERPLNQCKPRTGESVLAVMGKV